MAMSARRTLETLTPGAGAAASSIRKKALPFILAGCGSCRAWLPSIFHRIQTRDPTKMNPIYRFRALILPVGFSWVLLASLKFLGMPLNLDFSSYFGIGALLTLLALFFWLGGLTHKVVNKPEIAGK